ncbi:MAG: hypothetical protein KBH07_07205 [Flavobacteriales bacterium]|nr:hypothetical protein [Flavobacteriales bacterium]MBP9080220.1 hypothetical protein [Flavobacteriales bacterium]
MSALVLAAATPAFSQWEGTDINPTSLSLVYTDSLHDWLLVAVQGQPMTINDSAYLPMLRYNGLAWDTLGLFGHYVRTAVVYHDTLFVGGVFDYVRNSTASNIAYYANGAWHPYGTFTNQVDHGLVQRLRVVDDTLYAVGQFEYADGQFCQGLAKRVGAHWEPVQGWPDLALYADPWLMDIIRYQGKLVVSGNFISQDLTLKDMLQYNGTAWVPVCNGCLMGGQDGVATMVEYQEYLYVGGIFFYATGNAGQGIMRWNGQQWSSLRPPGEGLQNINYSDQYSPDIGDLKVSDGLLYIGGIFKFVDHQPTPAGICTWDGWAYCLFEGEPFSDSFGPFDFYQGSLYGATLGTSQNMKGLVRYTGELCTFSGVEDEIATAQVLRTVWSASGELTLLGLSDGPHTVKVYDAHGRVVLERSVTSAARRSEGIRFTGQSSALYLVVVDGQRTGRLVPIR